ncbi:MAG TPA: hypothetical protein VH796_04025 [Nitrososphaeraceae archaeon]|jgi:hypothetical protein
MVLKITNTKSLGLQVSDKEHQEMKQLKIELWSDRYESQFGVCLSLADTTTRKNNNNHQQLLFLAKTDSNSRYTHVVAESDYVDDFKNGWGYTLGHFIELYKEALQQHPQEEYLEKIEPIQHHTVHRSHAENASDRMKKDINIQGTKIGYHNLRIMSWLKCHYCDLNFDDVQDRKGHELDWHV